MCFYFVFLPDSLFNIFINIFKLNKTFSKSLKNSFKKFLMMRYNVICNIILSLLPYFLLPLNHIAHVYFSFWINQGQEAYLASQIDTYYRSDRSHFPFSSLFLPQATSIVTTFQQLLSRVKLLSKKSIRTINKFCVHKTAYRVRSFEINIKLLLVKLAANFLRSL